MEESFVDRAGTDWVTVFLVALAVRVKQRIYLRLSTELAATVLSLNDHVSGEQSNLTSHVHTVYNPPKMLVLWSHW